MFTDLTNRLNAEAPSSRETSNKSQQWSEQNQPTKYHIFEDVSSRHRVSPLSVALCVIPYSIRLRYLQHHIDQLGNLHDLDSGNSYKAHRNQENSDPMQSKCLQRTDGTTQHRKYRLHTTRNHEQHLLLNTDSQPP
jgi:hypothetical protein